MAFHVDIDDLRGCMEMGYADQPKWRGDFLCNAMHL